MALSMNISTGGLGLIEEFEGFRRDLYNDLTPQLPISHPNSDGHCTVGIGHKVHDGICDGRGSEAPYRNGISHADAIALKKKDARLYVKGVNDAVTVPLNQNQFDALVCFTFNLGVGTLQRSTFLGQLNQGKYAAVPPGLKLYNKAREGGVLVVLAGLVRRRQAEADLWNTLEEEDNNLASAEYTELSRKIDDALNFAATAARELQKRHDEQATQIEYLSKVVVELNERTLPENTATDDES